jgi:hypothetical protein
MHSFSCLVVPILTPNVYPKSKVSSPRTSSDKDTIPQELLLEAPLELVGPVLVVAEPAEVAAEELAAEVVVEEPAAEVAVELLVVECHPVDLPPLVALHRQPSLLLHHSVHRQHCHRLY